MRRSIVNKYFWGLNPRALKETQSALCDPSHLQFRQRLTVLLSRCDRPKELFSIISKKDFIGAWPDVRAYWIKREKESEFRDWWQTIYEELLQKQGTKLKPSERTSSAVFTKVGQEIKDARIRKTMSQKELASIVGMRQPDISRIEEGAKNVTLKTLSLLCKVLDIKTIDLP